MNEIIEKVTGQYTQNPKTMKIERVAAYVRVSHQEQKLHGLSLDAQRMKLAEYAEKNGMRIVEWYVDEGVSGRKLIRNRPELQRMIQDAEKGQFDRIIFIKLDRFFRSVAEYHECMKRIAPVIWSTTEEEYDLTTANGRMLVNMKLTIAEMEADQTGERIDLVNEYKTSTGQPLSGSMPISHAIATDSQTGRKKVIRNPEHEEAIYDLIQFMFAHQSRRKAIVYLKTKYNISISYKSLANMLGNTMLCGAYRDNPNYCEGYMSKQEFDKLQEINGEHNVKDNNAPNRAYFFTGLIKCPVCGRRLTGSIVVKTKPNGKQYRYKRYRCVNNAINKHCTFNKTIMENTLQKLMLANIEQYLEDAKVRAAEVNDSKNKPLPKHDIDDIHARIDRLNYSWQTGKIRTVEQYEKDYAELMELLDEAENEQKFVVIKDFSKVEAILQDGWRGIYDRLDDEHKRAFWRSFIRSIEVNWTTDKKEITRVNFF